jgi:hypothetical protein
MNETYQKPGKWDELILYPSVSRYDSRHFVMSYIIKQLEQNSVYEVMVQARNRFGWNEVSYHEGVKVLLAINSKRKSFSFFSLSVFAI